MKFTNKLPLTETTYYILIALTTPNHGYAIMQDVELISNGSVRIAAGTMYGALENLLKQKFIQTSPSDDPRRKMYEISNSGKEILALHVERLKHQIQAYEEIMNEEDNDESI